jgi:hypothetical protein
LSFFSIIIFHRIRITGFVSSRNTVLALNCARGRALAAASLILSPLIPLTAPNLSRGTIHDVGADD